MSRTANRRSTAPAVRLYRVLRLLLHVFGGLLEIALLFPFYGRLQRNRAVGRWSARLLAILRVGIRMQGHAPDDVRRAAVLVANHVSWLDIPVIHSVWQVRFVAKAEVRRWPVIGWMSARAGTLFVERGKSRHAARINQTIHDAISRGDGIGIFPEGSTTDGTELMRFHASLLQPAVVHGALVYPVALRYRDENGDVNVDASYVGDTTLAESLRMILAQRFIVAEMMFLPPVDAGNKSRRELAAQMQSAIAAALNLPASDRKPDMSAGPQGAPR
ncbi:MAG: lysophospholipid acyltransferase family protein [Burkholderiales bacterium]